MTTPRGIVAPEGYLWARDHVGRWHGLRVADLTDEAGDYRRMVRSVCGDWASTTPWTAGHWAEITRWLPRDYALCGRCMEAAEELEQSLCLYVAPAPEPQRLF